LEVGEARLVHIVPSNTPVLSRPFIAQVRRCEESLHKMANLEGLLATRGIHQPKSEVSPQGYADLYSLWKEQYERSGAHPSNVLN
jgi:V-type H+-transporting ATPase subunit a